MRANLYNYQKPTANYCKFLTKGMGNSYMELILTKLTSAIIMLYRWFLSPLKPYCSCRFYPTCSQYALDAIRIHGFISGAMLTIKRILRCHPWGECGIDPVPDKIKVSN